MSSLSPVATLVLVILLAPACTSGGTESPPTGATSPPTASEPEHPSPTAFDRAAARAEAEALLGLPEEEIEESPGLRIARRGDEEFALTMDLVPGRMNVELDDDGTGTYVVTRVVVETPADQDSIVVE